MAMVGQYQCVMCGHVATGRLNFGPLNVKVTTVSVGEWPRYFWVAICRCHHDEFWRDARKLEVCTVSSRLEHGSTHWAYRGFGTDFARYLEETFQSMARPGLTVTVLKYRCT
mgnify:CR=1 FL=1